MIKMVPSEIQVEDKPCPVCVQNGRDTKLELCQINLSEAVYMCKLRTCTYPMGYDCIYVDRDILETDSSSDGDSSDSDIEKITKLFTDKASKKPVKNYKSYCSSKFDSDTEDENSDDIVDKALNILKGKKLTNQKKTKENTENIFNNSFTEILNDFTESSGEKIMSTGEDNIKNYDEVECRNSEILGFNEQNVQYLSDKLLFNLTNSNIDEMNTGINDFITNDQNNILKPSENTLSAKIEKSSINNFNFGINNENNIAKLLENTPDRTNENNILKVAEIDNDYLKIKNLNCISSLLDSSAGTEFDQINSEYIGCSKTNNQNDISNLTFDPKINNGDDLDLSTKINQNSITKFVDKPSNCNITTENMDISSNCDSIVLETSKIDTDNFEYLDTGTEMLDSHSKPLDNIIIDIVDLENLDVSKINQQCNKNFSSINAISPSNTNINLNLESIDYNNTNSQNNISNHLKKPKIDVISYETLDLNTGCNVLNNIADAKIDKVNINNLSCNLKKQNCMSLLLENPPATKMGQIYTKKPTIKKPVENTSTAQVEKVGIENLNYISNNQNYTSNLSDDSSNPKISKNECEKLDKKQNCISSLLDDPDIDEIDSKNISFSSNNQNNISKLPASTINLKEKSENLDFNLKNPKRKLNLIENRPKNTILTSIPIKIEILSDEKLSIPIKIFDNINNSPNFVTDVTNNTIVNIKPDINSKLSDSSANLTSFNLLNISEQTINENNEPNLLSEYSLETNLKTSIDTFNIERADKFDIENIPIIFQNSAGGKEFISINNSPSDKSVQLPKSSQIQVVDNDGIESVSKLYNNQISDKQLKAVQKLLQNKTGTKKICFIKSTDDIKPGMMKNVIKVKMKNVQRGSTNALPKLRINNMPKKGPLTQISAALLATENSLKNNAKQPSTNPVNVIVEQKIKKVGLKSTASNFEGFNFGTNLTKETEKSLERNLKINLNKELSKITNKPLNKTIVKSPVKLPFNKEEGVAQNANVNTPSQMFSEIIDLDIDKSVNISDNNFDVNEMDDWLKTLFD